MKLASYSGNSYQPIRDLKPGELKKNARYKKIFIEAQNRLVLFSMLRVNYEELQNYLKSLLSPQLGDTHEEKLNLDRLLLNYLTCAYTIREHFNVSFQRRFRKDAKKQKEFSDFKDRLYKQSWGFAFFTDYRNYVQHCGLGIGLYRRTVSKTSVILKIQCDARVLLKDTSVWKASKLDAKKGKIDLIDLLQEYHHHMFGSYGVYVTKACFPELDEVAAFYGELTREVKATVPNGRMVFGGIATTRPDGSNAKIQLKNILGVPNDVYAELGLIRR